MGNKIRSGGVIALPHPAASAVADIVDSAIKGIQPGDLLFFDAGTGRVKPANTFTWDTNTLTTQTAFALRFCGVAKSVVDGNTRDATELPVDIGNDEEFVFDCVAATYAPGDLLAPAKQAGGNALERATLDKASVTAAAAIFKVTRPTGANATKVYCKIVWGSLGNVNRLYP